MSSREKPGRRATVGHRHVTHSHGVHHAEDGKWTANGMTTFHANQAADFACTEGILNSYKEEIKEELQKQRI